jgi:hypothetical protein
MRIHIGITIAIDIMNTKMMMTMMMIDDKYDDGYHLTFLFQQRSRVLQHYE